MALSNTKLPQPREIFLSHPLYESIVFDENHLEDGFDLKYFDDPLDAYCPQCENHSIFLRVASEHTRDIEHDWTYDHLFQVEFQCSRDNNHSLLFLFRVEGTQIQKIGQYPSLAELNLYDIKKYAKTLDKIYYREFTKAIGLAAHGIGVGSFVYLRRIFESLVEVAHREIQNNPDFDEELSVRARMSDKIEMLKSCLPLFLVENKGVYGILSKGIHELTDEECLSYFPVVKNGIEIILDAKLRKIEEEKKINESKLALSKIIRTI